MNDDISVEFTREVLVKRAKKERRCFICGEVIRIGSSYYYWAQKDNESGFWTAPICPSCHTEPDRTL